MKDTKGVRQVLEEWLIRFARYSNTLTPHKLNEPIDPIVKGAIDDHLLRLQEIMLGMLPENPYKAKQNPQKTETQQTLATAEYAFDTAIQLTEQNIRGGFNNG